MDDLLSRTGEAHRDFYERIHGAFLHRPYHRMPINALAALYLWGLSRRSADHGQLAALCETVGADPERVLEEMGSSPDLFVHTAEGRQGASVYAESMKVVRGFRKTEAFRGAVAQKLMLGTDLAMDLGNLYTASLPAWIAAGLVEARERGVELAGEEFLCVGYGSGDAAEATVIQIAERWADAAERINFREALQQRVVLDKEDYEALQVPTQGPHWLERSCSELGCSSHEASCLGSC